MKPTRSAKRTETWRRSAAAARGPRTAPARRRSSPHRTRRRTAPRQLPGGRSDRRATSPAPHSAQNFAPARFSAPQAGAGHTATFADAAAPARSSHGAAPSRSNVARASPSERLRRAAGAERLGLLDLRDGQPERHAQCSGSARPRRPVRPRRPLIRARIRIAFASRNGGRCPGGSSSIEPQQLFGFRDVAERERSLERVHDAGFHALERRAHRRRDLDRPRARRDGLLQPPLGAPQSGGGSEPRTPVLHVLRILQPREHAEDAAAPRRAHHGGSGPRHRTGGTLSTTPPECTCSSVNSSAVASTSSQRPSISRA